MLRVSQITNDGDKWSSQDVEVLRSSFGKVLVSELSSKLGRTEQAIMTKAERLRLRRKKPWSVEEDRLIKQEFTPTVLVKLLGRTKDSILHRRRKLKAKA